MFTTRTQNPLEDKETLSETELLNKIFGTSHIDRPAPESFIPDQKFKEIYTITWCSLCDCSVITCRECRNSSCNGGGCEKCSTDFDEFNKTTSISVRYIQNRNKKDENK